MKGFPSLPNSDRKAAWRLSRWKLSLLVIQHRERMQLRLIPTWSEEVILWRRRSFLPALWFLSRLPVSASIPPPIALSGFQVQGRIAPSEAPTNSSWRWLPSGEYEPPASIGGSERVNSLANQLLLPHHQRDQSGAVSNWKLPYSRIRLPLDPLKNSSGQWFSKQQGIDSGLAERGERFLGPIYGLNPIAPSPRLNRFENHEDFERWEALRLLGPEKETLKARYGVRGKTQQTLAKARLGQATLHRRWSRRFQPHSLLADRPYRRIEGREVVLGRRLRPNRAARLRPLRRTDPLAERTRRERASLQGSRKNRLLKGQQSLLRLPNEQSWSRFVLPQNPRLAQERRNWWREWHQTEARYFYETRRAGSLQRDRVGRRNLGWWRFLRSSHFDFSNQKDLFSVENRFLRRPVSTGRNSRLANSHTHVITPDQWAYPSRFQPARDQRRISIGWSTRLKNHRHLETIVSQTPSGRVDYASSYWRLVAPLSVSSLWLMPCSFSLLWRTQLILQQSFLSVQKDFVRALDQLVRRGGRREMDPEWMEWLLETLGISQQNAGIRQYQPGNRSLARSLAGLRRERTTLLEVVWYLRTQRHQWGHTGLGVLIGHPKPAKRGPRPTLLVGAPGTGKTRLVRVLADEAGVPVIYQCLAAFTDAGSNFTAFGFGRTVAPRAVQRGFAEARDRVPSILFLDELDALGANRGGVLLDSQNPQGGPTRSGDQVLGLGQLLVELDSRRKNQGLVVFGATNRPKELDPALLRPGRFDRHLSISLPNRKKRRAILQLYARQRGLPTNDWNWEQILAQTKGVSAAHLARITNWTAISRVLSPTSRTTSQLLQQSLQRLLRTPKEPIQVLNGRDPFSKIRAFYAKARPIVIQEVLQPTGENSFPRVTTELPVFLFSTSTYRTKKEKQTRLCSTFSSRIAETILLQSIRGKTRSYWQQRNLPSQGWWLSGWLMDTHSLFPAAQRIQPGSILTKEFKQDRPLLRYSLQKTDPFQRGNLAGPGSNATPTFETLSTRFASLINEVKQQEEWPREWYSFEIPEVRGFRSVHWLPPELHLKTSRLDSPKHALAINRDQSQLGNTPTTENRRLRMKLYKQTLQVLETHRSELDLLVSSLLQRNEITQLARQGRFPARLESRRIKGTQVFFCCGFRTSSVATGEKS